MHLRTCSVLLLLAISLTSIGCASKAEVEDLRTQLAACDEERARAEASVIAWEQRFDRENRRWQEMEQSVIEAVPQALGEIHQERERILELVPEQVEDEVSAYLDDYFATVMKGFELLKKDNRDIQLQLDATFKALQAVGKDTRSIGTAIDGALADERAKRDAIGQQLGGLTGELTDIVNQIVGFDQQRINCKNCKDRLRLNRNQREAILGFHSELMLALANVQASTSAVASEAPTESSLPGDGTTTEDSTTTDDSEEG